MIVLPQVRGLLRPHLVVSGVTWNPADKSSDTTLSNGNLTATASGLSSSQVRATASASAGKLYWEVHLDIGPVSSAPFLGIRPVGNAFALGTGPFSSGGDYGCFVSSPNTGHQDYQPGSNLGAIVAPSVASGDVYIFAVDFGAGKLWIGRNGTWDASGNPATGANPRATVGAGTYCAWASCHGVTVTAHFSAASWTYTVPSGFTHW